MIRRRQFLQGLSAAGLLLGNARSALAQAMTHARIPPAEATPGFEPDVELSLRAEPGTVQLLDGAPTVWRWDGPFGVPAEPP